VRVRSPGQTGVTLHEPAGFVTGGRNRTRDLDPDTMADQRKRVCMNATRS
jgi:hypothetical protein